MTYVMIVAPLKMRIEVRPYVNDGHHQSVVTFEEHNLKTGECIRIPLFETEHEEE